MHLPPIDVIIPAFNNAATMARVLQALRRQLLPEDHVTVVDDGSTDETPLRAAVEQDAYSSQLLVVRQSHSGPAAARNAGLARAQRDLVLFLGADVIPSHVLLERHRAVHRAYPEETSGCLGLVTWDPTLPPTPFMVWLEHGVQNPYRAIAGSQWVDAARHCYGSNLSLKRSLLARVGGFDAAHFSGYGWEDIDLGCRLVTVGFRLFYEPAARGCHAHRRSVADILDRQRAVGRGLRTLLSLHPGVVQPPPAARRSYRALRFFVYPPPVRWAARRLAAVAEGRWILPGLYARVTGWAFTDGVQASTV